MSGNDGLIKLNREQCPLCFQSISYGELISEPEWEAMTVPQRVTLCKMANINPKMASRDYDKLTINCGNIYGMDDDDLLQLSHRYCKHCGTKWSLEDFLKATTTPNMLELFNRNESY